MKILTAVPLLLVSIVIYNFLAFGLLAFGHGDSVNPAADALAHVVFSVKMVSGEFWNVTVSDLILVFSLLFLFIEIVRATNIRTVAVTNNALSMFVFVLALIEFLIVKGFSTSTFFLITVMALIDTIAGFIIGMISARRDIGLDPTGIRGV